MTDIVFDTEFLDDGQTVNLISIGMINRDTGAELYLINREADWTRIERHEFLCRNVIPHLPLHRDVTFDPQSGVFDFRIDRADPRFVDAHVIARSVAEFILAAPDPRLCAWYASYDMIALNQLWGSMVDKPAGIPWWAWDFKQECDRLGIADDDLPPQTEGLHDALADARTLLARMEWLEAIHD